MYALCVSGAVNTQGFVWKFFMRYTNFFIHSFKNSQPQPNKHHFFTFFGGGGGGHRLTVDLSL